MSSSIITQMLGIESGRAFPNQFEITVSDAADAGASTLAKSFTFYATKIALGSYAVDSERILSTQSTIIKKATVPDVVTLTIKETEDWATLKYFWKWYTTYYYDPLNNLFRTGRAGKRKTFTIYALCSPYVMTSVSDQTDNAQKYKFKITVKDALLVGPVQLPTFDYKVSDPVEHNFTIQSDYITLEFDGTQIPGKSGLATETAPNVRRPGSLRVV